MHVWRKANIDGLKLRQVVKCQMTISLRVLCWVTLSLDIRGSWNECAENWAKNSPTLAHHLTLKVLSVTAPYPVEDRECLILEDLSFKVSKAWEVTCDLLLREVPHSHLE